MFKRFVSAFLAVIMLCTMMSTVSFADDFEETLPISIADGEDIEEYDPNKEYEVGDTVYFVEEDEENPEFQLFMTATYQGKCYRTWQNKKGYVTNLYQNVSDTSRTTYASNGQTIYTEEIWRTSTGVYRYKTTNVWHNSSGTITYGQMFVENQNMTLLSTNHTFSHRSVHYSAGHYKVCDYCGVNYGDTTKQSDCYSCYPGYIYYYDIPGNIIQTVQVNSAAAVILKGTIPTKFKYKFLGWNTNSGATTASYLPNDSVYVSAGRSLDLYPIWEEPVVLSTTTETTYSAPLNARESIGYFEFTPTETATYVFESTIKISFSDTVGYLYDAEGNELAFNDNWNDQNGDFRITYDLVAGNTYYYGVKYKDITATGTMPVRLRRQYNIVFDANGGSNAPTTQTKAFGDTLVLTEEKPYKHLWQFNGWATSADATELDYPAGGEFTENSDTTLYAVWGYPTGKCGDNATWLYKDNVLYISGTGDMYDYTAIDVAPWSDCINDIEEIVIDKGVTSIGSYAFSGCSKVTSVTLPDTIETLGEYAFANCSLLETVEFNSDITSIEKYTFNECVSLKNIELPNTVEAIGEYAFFGCSSMGNLTLPDSLKGIGTYAFANCSGLESINIPSGVTTIEAYTFEGDSKLNEVKLPDTLEVIKEFAFSKCSGLKEIVVPKRVTEIERGAFSNCSSLTSATIPDSVTTIGTSIFAYVKDIVTVKCYLDTTAHNYAKDNDIKFEIMPWGVLEKPSFDRADIDGGITVSISAPKGTVHYTTDGSDPTESSPVYSGPVTARKNMTIKAVAKETGWADSEVAEYYTNIEKVSSPYSSTGTNMRVTKGTKIELYCETYGATIWCTTDNSIPTSSDLYEGPIEINENTTIYAVAVKNGMLNSSLVTFNYEISNAEDTPEVVTLDATDITESSAKVSAEVYDNNGIIYDVQFVYYEKNNSGVKYTVAANEENSAVLTGLSPDTEYWYQVRAINEKGWSYGYIKTFKTDAQGVIKPASIDIEPGYISVKVGQKKTLLATVLPMSADNRDIYWSSEDTSVATVDEDGTVTAVGLGNTRIKATTVSNRLVAYCNVDVISTKVVGDFNFSEHNMITNSSNYDIHGFDHNVNAGGNALMASAYLARWDGAVLEENDAYPDSLLNVKYREISPDYHIQNIMYLPYRSDSLDNDEIKNAIIKYGAVYTSFKVNYDYFDSSRTNYYFPTNANNYDGGHAIVIVGWDDDYSRGNFPITPAGNGAFICKNSWGPESGEDGYFYISYYDKFIARPNCGDYNAVFYDIESNDNYNKIYQYDYLGPVAAESMGTKVLYTANVFPEEGSSLTENETLKAVSFYTYTPGTPYEIYVVTNFEDKGSLKILGSPVKTGITEYAGYYTIKLDEPIALQAGTRFAVVVKQTGVNGNATVFIELPAYLSGGTVSHSSNARANPGESFIGMDTKTWADLTDFYPNANVCVKAFTETKDTVFTLQGIDNLNRDYTDDTVHNVEDLIKDGLLFNEGFINFYQDVNMKLFGSEEEFVFGFAPPSILPDLNTNNNYSEGSALPSRYDLREEESMTSVKNQGNIGSCWSFATYASLESSIKKSSFASSSLSSDGLNQAAGDAASIVLDTTGAIVALGNTLQLKATVLPFDSKADIIWQSSDSSIVSVSSYGLVRALGVGNAYVTASTPDGKVTAQCAVTVTAPVKVDLITINNTEDEITAGNKLLIDYSVYPENAGDKSIIWEVDDTSVATVNEYGLLTAKLGGSVTVTAYSADKSVYDTYTLNIDDGFECNTVITANNLGIYDTNIFGSVSTTITNKTNSAIDCIVMMAIYDSENELVKTITQSEKLSVGDNPVPFNNIYIPGLSDTKYNIKIFVWRDTGTIKPIATPKTDYIG